MKKKQKKQQSNDSSDYDGDCEGLIEDLGALVDPEPDPAEDEAGLVPLYTWSARAVEQAVDENLIEYSARPAHSFVMSGPLSPHRRCDIGIRLLSDRRFKSVTEARAYYERKFGVVYEDQSRPDLGYYAFVLPVLGN